MLLNKSSTQYKPVATGKAAVVAPRQAVVAKNTASNASLETAAPKAAVKGSAAMLASTTTAQTPAAVAPGVMPAVLGAGLLGAGVLLGKSMSGGNGKQQEALAAQVARQQASMQAALAAQQTQQAQMLARALEGKGMSAEDASSAATEALSTSLDARARAIQQFFPTALTVDDYMNRVEVALASLGFTGDNTIAMSNLCRDESCLILEDKIESVFGSCFSTHGLGGVLTCGVIGIKAGLSHSPVLGGKEQYVFFSFPHIAIDSNNTVGKISRPNRPGSSSACGALCACLADFQSNGLEGVNAPGVHDAENPEYSILKARLARQLKSEGCNPANLDLVSITAAAERTIANDLEHLISQAVDTSKANYAVFTGVQIHNWAADLANSTVPSMEFVTVGKAYAVIDGQKQAIDVLGTPALAPRQLRVLGAVSETMHPDNKKPNVGDTFNQEVPRGYLLRRLGGAAGTKYVQTPDMA